MVVVMLWVSGSGNVRVSGSGNVRVSGSGNVMG